MTSARDLTGAKRATSPNSPVLGLRSCLRRSWHHCVRGFRYLCGACVLGGGGKHDIAVDVADHLTEQLGEWQEIGAGAVSGPVIEYRRDRRRLLGRNES